MNLPNESHGRHEPDDGQNNPSNNPFAATADQRPRSRWRFGLFSLMLAMMVFGVIGVAGNQLLRAVRQGASPKAAFVMFTLTAPVMLVTIVSLARAIAEWARNR